MRLCEADITPISRLIQKTKTERIRHITGSTLTGVITGLFSAGYISDVDPEGRKVYRGGSGIEVTLVQFDRIKIAALKMNLTTFYPRFSIGQRAETMSILSYANDFHIKLR